MSTKKPLQQAKDPLMTQLMIWNVPRELKADFKAACAAEGSTMRDAIITMMRHYSRLHGERVED